jgi:PKD repeat protein
MSNIGIPRPALVPALVVLAAGLAFLTPVPAAAQCSDGSCGWASCGTPALPAPFGGEIAPAGAISADRDSTGYNPSPGAGSGYQPLFMDLDVANGWIFTGHSQGLQIWDARTTPANPSLVRTVIGANFADWISDPHETHPMRAIAVPPGKDDLVAAAVAGGGGVSVFDTRDKKTSALVYGDTDKTMVDLYAGTIGGVDYLFAASAGKGLRAYRLSTVRTLAAANQKCIEDTSAGAFCNVYAGQIGSRTNVTRVGGVGDASGTKHWVAMASGGTATGFDVVDVSNPAAPQVKITSNDPIFVYAIEMWRNGAQIYLALRGEGSGSHVSRIYDVSCLAGGGACSLGAPLWSATMPGDTGEQFLTHSTTGGRHFLYFGNFNKCATGPQNEWLYDVTAPAQAWDVTPGPQLVGGQNTGYWGWYYRKNTGFNQVAGRVGRFYGEYFYRAAYSIFDVHILAGGVPPVADFAWTGEADGKVYEGTSVTFEDLSSAVPDSWSWIFGGGSPGTSTDENPSGITFATTGTKPVELTACNGAGCSSPKTKNLSVLSATPALQAVTATPSPALQCQTVTFAGQGAQGKPPLTYAFELKDPTGTSVVKSQTGSASTMSWQTGAGTAAGVYPVTLELQNLLGSAQASGSVTLQALPSLPGAGSFAPTNDPFGNNVVQLHVSAPGATEWKWDFDDGTVTSWTSDATSGPNPTHTFTATGTYDVSVQVRNCVEGPVTSGVLTVEIANLEPLVPRFQAQGCAFGFCIFEPNKSVGFVDSTAGEPDTWEYDWNGDGTYEDGSNAVPRTSHTYATEGTFQPKLRVWRGVESAVYTHGAITIAKSTGGGNPALSISGPSSGTVGATLTYTANATNCTPSAGGWSWSLSSGQTVNQSGASITVSWPAAGTKTVQVTNSACGSATGTRSVQISGGGGGGTGDCGAVGGDGLRACIQSSVNERTVTLGGSGSAGGPTSYTWTFGDGASANGSGTTHTYAADGTYSVKLEITKSGQCTFGFCSASHTVQIPIDTSGGGGGGGGGGGSGNCGPTGQGGLQACFEFAPETPGTGEAVTFDGTSSKKTPDEYSWSFEGGGEASGATTSRTFDAAGSYDVTLTVGKLVAGSQCAFGFCTASVTRTVEVVGEAPKCRDSEHVICLNDARFRVEAEWWDGKGNGGQATAVGLTEDTGYFTFFSGKNVELVVKALDGSEINGHYWIFYGALSNLGFEITVTDTETESSRVYHNDPGQFASRGDVEALPSVAPGGDGLNTGGLAARSATPIADAAHDGASACVQTDTRLCLSDRWAIDVTFTDPEKGPAGGHAKSLTKDTGYFWFFGQKNVELVVKVIDGRSFNGKYWVFYGSLTDVAFDLTVTDLHTGAQATYHNDAGSFASNGDINALPGS